MSYLDALEELDGQPDLLRAAIGIMESLDQQAQAMMSTDIDWTSTPGPRVVQQPSNH